MRARFTWVLISLAVIAGCHADHPATTPIATTAEPDAAAVHDALAARREVALERLAAYRVAGEYPVDADGMPTGVFRDERGVRCPMSELIFQSGRGDLVDAVVRMDNRLRLATVHDGPLMTWMLQSGLTQEEIIEIQGVMELNQANFQIEVSPGDLKVARRAAVTTKLVAVEAALRRNTARSVATAVRRLAPADKQAVTAQRRVATAPR